MREPDPPRPGVVPMPPLKRLLDEIHGRSLWQVATLYLAGGWVVLQVIATIADQLFLPGWVFATALVLVLLGLPIVLTTAFVQKGIRSKPGTVATGLRGLLTWRRALLGGAIGFMLLGIGTASFTISRAIGIGPAATLVARGVLDERATVVLADFSPVTSQDARAATEAFRIDLSQSRVIRLAKPSRLNGALARMQHDPTDPLDRETAIEVAVREGFPGVIAGEINRAGVGYVFSADIVSQSGDDVLASVRTTAADSTEVLDAIEELSKKLRERIGESVSQIRGEPPLGQVTTSDLQALRNFSQGLRLVQSGRLSRGRTLLEEAVARDTAFASAWAALGVMLSNIGEERAVRVDAFERAYRHRDRLTEAERHLVEGRYFSQVRRDPNRAAAAFEVLLELDPDDSVAMTNLSDLYLWLRRYDRAVELATRSLAIDSMVDPAAWNLSEALGRLGRFEEAMAEVREHQARSKSPSFDAHLAYLYGSRGDYEAAETALRELRATQVNDPLWQATTSVGLASVAAVRGKLDAAIRHLDDAARTNEERGLQQEALRNHVWASYLAARPGDDSEAARRRLEMALDRIPLDDLDLLDRPYTELAEGFAAAGDPEAARHLMEEMEDLFPSDLVLGGDYANRKLSVEHPDRTRGEIALAEGRAEDAIEDFRRSDVGYCRPCALPALGRAYDAAGQVDSARVVYERYLETPEPFRLASGDAIYRGFVLERLGQLYDEVGDLENAAKYYAMFVELWAEADEDLQPRVRAGQARLEEIVAERG
ncbi:MAG: tetratricopeptide (TPR) repeat protein [Myxococcota bacterium]|jgi:tetratricopeptide (TPR) repeat protein